MLFRIFTGFLSAFLTVRRQETDRQTGLCQLIRNTALNIGFFQSAKVRVLLSKSSQPLFQSGVVGVDVVQRKELLASKKISDIDYSYEIQKKAAQQNQNVDTGKSALNITDKANNYVKAYAELYDEIVKGYENGTREIYVADENGPRKLTKDEELSNLDAAYKKTVDDFVTMETTNQHARGIIGEEMNKISKITTRSTLASAYIEEQKTRGKDEIPENLTEKMYGAITSFKEKYTMIQPNIEQLLMSIKI